MNLTADEAVARALERNVALQSQRLTPRTFDYSIAATLSVYRPTLSNDVQPELEHIAADPRLKADKIVNHETSRWNSGVQGGSPGMAATTR